MQCRDEKHIILVLEFIIQLTLQAKKKKKNGLNVISKY